MDYRLDEEQEAFVAEVRRFLDGELNREVVREVAGDERMGPHAKAFLRKMAPRFQEVGLPTWQVDPSNP